MTATLSDEFVFEYFSQLNPIAFKIQTEINQAIENYEHYWNDLDKREQMTIINEAVIKPEIQISYRTKEASTKEESSLLDQYRDLDKSLLNYFVPKTDSCRPFSYKSKSQQNLFYSFNAAAAAEDTDDLSAVRLPVAKPKNHQVNKSTDSLNTTCNLVSLSLNVKAKKGRAPAAPVKMTTKPPPPPPPAKPTVAPPVAPVIAPVAVPVSVSPPVEVSQVVLAEMPKIPEDSNSNSSLISPAETEETPRASPPANLEPSDDEYKSLLSSNGFDFLNNW